jgi:hypothetical protein
MLASRVSIVVPKGRPIHVSPAFGTVARRGGLRQHAAARSQCGGQHVALTAQTPATRRKTSYALPDSSGNWNFAKATGTLNLKGVLHIALGKRSVAMKSVTFTRPAKGNGLLTAKIGGHKVKLFTVTGKVHVKESGTTETLTDMTAKLTKPGATKIDNALRKKRSRRTRRPDHSPSR